MIKLSNTPEEVATQIMHLVRLYGKTSEFEKKVVMELLKLVTNKTRVTISTLEDDGVHSCEIIEFPNSNGGVN